MKNHQKSKPHKEQANFGGAPRGSKQSLPEEISTPHFCYRFLDVFLLEKKMGDGFGLRVAMSLKLFRSFRFGGWTF